MNTRKKLKRAKSSTYGPQGWGNTHTGRGKNSRTPCVYCSRMDTQPYMSGHRERIRTHAGTCVTRELTMAEWRERVRNRAAMTIFSAVWVAALLTAWLMR